MPVEIRVRLAFRLGSEHPRVKLMHLGGDRIVAVARVVSRQEEGEDGEWCGAHQKLMIGFRPPRDWEHTFDPFWSEVPYAEQETAETVNEDPCGFVWFSPHQNACRQRLMPPAVEEYSAAM